MRMCMLLALLALAPDVAVHAGATAVGQKTENVIAGTLSPELLRQDLDFLFKSIEEIHPNMYAYTGRKEFDRCKRRLYQRIDHPMTAGEFYWELAPVVASLKMGHMNIWPHENKSIWPPEALTGDRSVFPLQIRLAGATVVLERNFSSVSLPPGSAVESINGEQALGLVTGLARCFAAERSSMRPALFQMLPGFLNDLLLLRLGPVERWTVRLRSPDGQRKAYVVESVPLSKVIGEQPQQGVESAACTCRYVPEHRSAVLRVRSFGEEESKFADDLRRCFQQIADYKASSLIVDIRQNGGGSPNNADALIEYLTEKPYRQFEECRVKLSPQVEAQLVPLRSSKPQLFEGKKVGDMITLDVTFDGQPTVGLRTPPGNPLRFKGSVLVLIDSGSCSTSMSFAACVKHFKIGTLIGEETGDPTTCYDDSTMVKLPNSGFVLSVPSTIYTVVGDRKNGWGVMPDHTVKQQRRDTAKGLDTVMQFALKRAGDVSATRQPASEP